MAMVTSVLRALFEDPPHSNPAEQQRLYIEAFHRAMPMTRFQAWAVGSEVPLGSFILVGVMIGWNRYDQQLAVALDEAIATDATGSDILALISTDEMTAMRQIQEAFPGLAGIGQSPFVSWWTDGKLNYVDAGPSAASWLADRFRLRLP
jgi:hypothetical protein